eukprot:3148985-Prymnesium_polylepis.1
MDSRRIRESSRPGLRRFATHSHKFARVCRVCDTFANISNGFADSRQILGFATDSRICGRIRDAFAKVLDEIHTVSRRICDGFAHSPSQFAHIRKGSRRIKSAMPPFTSPVSTRRESAFSGRSDPDVASLL